MNGLHGVEQPTLPLWARRKNAGDVVAPERRLLDLSL